jgi:hypothetical protein
LASRQQLQRSLLARFSGLESSDLISELRKINRDHLPARNAANPTIAANNCLPLAGEVSASHPAMLTTTASHTLISKSDFFSRKNLSVAKAIICMQPLTEVCARIRAEFVDIVVSAHYYYL